MPKATTPRFNLKAQWFLRSALCFVLLNSRFTPTAQAQSISVSGPQWKNEFRLASTSTLTSPVFYSAWVPKQGRANPCLDLRGGVIIQSPRQSDAACRLIDHDEDPNTLAMEWQMNAPLFELLCAPTGGSWRVLMREGNAPTWTPLGQWSSAGWTAPRVQVFSDAMGARRSRRFRVEYANQLAWGVRLERRESITGHPPFPLPRRVVWCGDSFIEGVSSPSVWQGFAAQASLILGLDANFDGSGGTGYMNDGPWNGLPPHAKRTRYIRRLSNIISSNPSIVVMYGSTNDLKYPPAQVASAASAYWNSVRRALPQAQIIVMGPVRMGSIWSTTLLNEALRQAARRYGFAFIDASDWITGTGKIDAPRRDGNADQFRASDGAHPTAAGHAFIGQKVAEALRPLINPK